MRARASAPDTPSAVRINPATRPERLKPLLQCVEHGVALAHERRRELRDRPQLRQARQHAVVVVERKVDVEAVVRLRGNAQVEPAFQIDHDVHAARAAKFH